MANKKNMTFQYNDLIAIEIALESQIDSIHDFLDDPSTDFLVRPKLQESLRWSDSALEKIQSMLKASLPK